MYLIFEEKKVHAMKTICYLCCEKFLKKCLQNVLTKVTHNFHYTGNLTGAAHLGCSLRYNYLPVKKRNLSMN